MKRTISITLILAMIITFALPISIVSATAYNAADANWNWYYSDTASGQAVTLNGYKGTDTDLSASEIPSVLNGTWFAANGGRDLTGLETDVGGGNYAVETMSSFDYSAGTTLVNKTPTLLTSIELPYGFKNVGGYSFRRQNALTHLYLPDSVTTIGTTAFNEMTSCQYLVLSKGLTTITGTSAFQNMKIGTAPTQLYFRNPVAPTLTGSMMWGDQKLLVYYPSSCTPEQVQAYKNLKWFSAADDATQQTMIANDITFAPYNFIDLPADAQTYYTNIGSGTADPNATPTPIPSLIPTSTPTSTLTPTPTPTPTPTSTPTPTPTPTSTPTPSITPTPSPSDKVNSIGYGTSFLLYPCDKPGVNLDGNAIYKLGSFGAVVDGTGAIAKGPYEIDDTAKVMNKVNGTAIINVAQGGTIDKSAFGSVYSHYCIGVSGAVGTSVQYIPKPGLLEGVDTKVSFSYFTLSTSTGSKGFDAIVTYDGGKTKNFDQIVPDGLINGGKSTNYIINIGDLPFTNLESVTLKTRGTGSIFIPSMNFLVVNDNPGSPAPDLPYRKYIQPNLDTITPGLPLPEPTPNADSPVSINEICSDNLNGIVDKSGAVNDWIELYNNSDADVDISGFGLTDDTDTPNKWSFPQGTTVPAKGYLLVFASKSDISLIDGELHTNFNISKGGETIMLSNKDGGIISIMNLPSLDTDKTLSRVPDGSSNLVVTDPTPGVTNDTANVISNFVNKPDFSAKSGFYPSNFDLTINSTPGTTIYYTLDGSVPNPANVRADDTVTTPPTLIPDRTFVYQVPVTISNRTADNNYLPNIVYKSCTFYPTVKVDKSMVVRAIAVDSLGSKSSVVTKSYFVGYNMKNDFNNTDVLSVVTGAGNLYDPTTGIFTNASSTNETEVPVHIDLFQGDGSLAINQDVGMTIRGLGSSTQNQKGLNFYARSEYGKSSFNYPIYGDLAKSSIDGSTIDSFDSFCVKSGDTRSNDDARYFDGGLQRMSGELGSEWQTSRTCSVFINGEYWGQYFIQERVSTDYIEKHYGVPKDDVELVKNHGAKGTTTTDEFNYINNTLPSWLATTDFTKEENLEQLESKFDMQNMLAYYAANLAVVNRDWVGAGFNFALWRSRTVTGQPYQDGKIRFMMYDLDASYYNTDADPDAKANLADAYSIALLTNPSLRNLYINAMCDVDSYIYEPNKVMQEMQCWQDEIQPLTPDLEARWNLTAVKGAINQIRIPVTGRPQYYYDYLTAFFTNQLPAHMNSVLKTTGWTWNFSGKTAYFKVKVNDVNAGGVQVNTIKPDFVKWQSYTGRYFIDIPSTLTALPKEGYRFTGWTASDGTTISSATDPSITVNLSANNSIVTANFEPIPVPTHYISTANDLINIAASINNDPTLARENYVLTNNIELDTTTDNNYTPIGNIATPFIGTFDGQGYTISGIKTNLDQQGQGLFGYVGINGVVKNVGVINCLITGFGLTGKNIGAIVGNNAGTIENCFSTGSVSGISTVGGITGNNSGGTVKNCFSVAAINSQSTTTLSGIAGKVENNGSVINCYSLITPVAKIDSGTVDELTSIKTADEFANGTVLSLLNANGNIVWQQGDTIPGLINNSVYVGLGYNAGTISISGITGKTDVSVVIASYDNGKLTDIALLPATLDASGNGTVTLPSGFTAGADGKIKIMLIDNTNTITPLCDSITVTK